MTDHSENLSIFRDTLQPILISRLQALNAPKRKRVKGRKNEIKPVVHEIDPESELADLIDFIEYLADEIFDGLPDELKTISYSVLRNDSDLAVKYSTPVSGEVLAEVEALLPPSVLDSLLTYSVIADETQLDRFLDVLLSNYIDVATTTPSEYDPSSAVARPDGCEICERTQLQLTYHHLIPREVHQRAVKRGWCADWEVNKVCWLCRACHSYVHKIATNEELAKAYNSIDSLLERDDVQKWASWARRIRWKAK